MRQQLEEIQPLRTALLSLSSLLLTVSSFIALSPPISAATYNNNNIMTDVVLDNVDTMSVSAINSFLNGFSASCISTNNGFSAADPIGYTPTNGFEYGSSVSAGQVIYDAAHAYGINPQVLLATLQKEQSLVDGSAGCNVLRYAAATGYGCPDGGSVYNYSGVNLYSINGVPVTSVSGTCVDTSLKVGFTQQVIRTSWLLKFGEQRSEGHMNWAVITTNWDNSDDPQSCYGGPMTQGTFQICPSGAITYYDGYTTIDGASVHMDNGTTAALYWYTPHFAGNQNFFNIFTSWFGSTQISVPYSWQLISYKVFSDSAFTSQISQITPLTLKPGQRVYLKVQGYNQGYQTWDSSTRIAVDNPPDRTSPFQDSSWIAYNRPASMVETSVPPSNNADFAFSITAPNVPGSYNEGYTLVDDGVSTFNDVGWMIHIDVVNPLVSSVTTTAVTNVPAGSYVLSPQTHSSLALTPDGNLVLSVNFKPVWATNTAGSGASYLVNQADGNIVLYNSQNKPVWASNTNGLGPTQLYLQSDGNLVSYGSGNTVVWATGTNTTPDELSQVNETLQPGLVMRPNQKLETPDRLHTLWLQGDGNLVLYNSQNKPVWASNTNGKSVAFLAMQTDGNLVLYNSSMVPIWASNTNTGIPSTFWLQEDGNLVLYNSQNKPVWASNTMGE